MKWLIFITLLFTACGKAVVDPTFLPYVDKFNQYAVEQKSDVRADGIGIAFYDGDGSAVAGHCQHGDIEIVRADWDKWTDNIREVQVLHELGHCALHREHDNSKQDNGLPKSIMNKYGIGGLYDDSHKAYYLNELFHP